MSDSQREVVEFLSNSTSYGLEHVPVVRHETHGAIVFLAGKRAYKLKRAVRYPYMDFSTVAARKAMCERELAINRRTAPELYLEVRPVVRDPNGRLRFGTGAEAGSALDWVVVMRRFEQSALLAEMQRQNLLTRPFMRGLAETIAEFHEQAEKMPSYGGRAGIDEVMSENVELLRKLDVDDANRSRIGQLNALSRSALAKGAVLLNRRRDAGSVRRCHGDLHLNNICMIDGRPVLFDAIEFNDSLACIDVLYDLAFPVMDLMRSGADDLANALLNRYLERTGDYDGLPTLPLFLSCRAAISAHVALSRANETGSADNAGEKLSRLLHFAISCLRRETPRLIAVGGLSGTGKSTLAYGLAAALTPAPGAIVVRSDIVRKILFGVPETSRLPESAYTDDMNERVCATMIERAGSILAAGFSAVVDAVHGEAAHRAAIANVAYRAGAAFTGLWLEAPTQFLEQRVSARSKDASDATIDVLHRQLAHIAPPGDWTRIDAGNSAAATLAKARSVAGVNLATRLTGNQSDQDSSGSSNSSCSIASRPSSR